MINSQYFDSVPVKEVFKKGGFDTKLSFLIMGFSNFYHKQIIKGCLFLLSRNPIFDCFCYFNYSEFARVNHFGYARTRTC